MRDLGQAMSKQKGSGEENRIVDYLKRGMMPFLSLWWLVVRC